MKHVVIALALSKKLCMFKICLIIQFQTNVGKEIKRKRMMKSKNHPK